MINKEKIANYVKNQNKNLANHRIGVLDLIIKDKMSDDIDITLVFNKINQVLPEHILKLIDIIYIGKFPFLNEKETNAAYMDGTIYISNVQDNNDDLLDDVLHEFSHATEDRYGKDIYEDNEVKNEFLLKRSKLEKILEHQGYDVDHLDFLNTEYDSSFDSTMYETIGYDVLKILTVDLFLDPYSPTSLREYFAAGFEEKYMGNELYLKKICPYLYNKVTVVHNNYEEKYEF